MSRRPFAIDDFERDLARHPHRRLGSHGAYPHNPFPSNQHVAQPEVLGGVHISVSKQRKHGFTLPGWLAGR